MRSGACCQQSFSFLGHPKAGEGGFESCRLVHGMSDFWKAWHRGLLLEGKCPELPSYCYGFQRARRREGVVASHLALAARCRHEGISFVDESLDMANACGLLERQATEKAIQPRLRDIDKFFFITWGRRIFTEVLAPDGIASGLAQVELVVGDKKCSRQVRGCLPGGNRHLAGDGRRRKWWHICTKPIRGRGTLVRGHLAKDPRQMESQKDRKGGESRSNSNRVCRETM